MWEQRRLPSGYDAVLRAVVLALRREFCDRIESGRTLTTQHISSILLLSVAHPPSIAPSPSPGIGSFILHISDNSQLSLSHLSQQLAAPPGSITK